VISTYGIYEDLRTTLDERVAKQIAHHFGAVYEDLQQTATKADMAELRAVVADLAQAQRQTAAGLNELRGTVADLGAGLNELRGTVADLGAGLSELRGTVAGLAESHKALQAEVRELAQAQKRTEMGLAELRATVAGLAEDQKAMRAELRQLAEAQRHTDAVLVKLAETDKQLKQDIGSLRHTVGYGLEDRAFYALPALLRRDHGLEVAGRLLRRHLPLRAGGHVGINILGKATQAGRRLHVVGEAKTQLFRRDVRKFLEKTLPAVRAELGEVFPLLVTYMTPEPGLEEVVRQQGVALYYSYDFVPPPMPL